MTSPSDTVIFRSLSGEWERTARTRKANATFESWKAIEPALEAVSSLDTLLRVRAELPPADANAVLGALLRIGDDLALRAILQVMLPTIGTTARYVFDKEWVGAGRPWATLAEVDQDLLSRAWNWLHERRGESIAWPAPTLSMCLIHAAQRTTANFFRDQSRVEPFFARRHDRPSRSSDRWTAEEDAIKLVCDAVEAGILPLGCAQLLYSVRLRGEGYAELSEALGRSEAALKQQCKRAGAKLRPLVAVA